MSVIYQLTNGSSLYGKKVGRITEKQAFMIPRLISEHAGTDDVEYWPP